MTKLHTKQVDITYIINGGVVEYNILPKSIYWGSTNFYCTPQWLLLALDLNAQVIVTLAMKDVLRWN